MQHAESKSHESYAHPVIDSAQIRDASLDETEARNLKNHSSDHKILKKSWF